MSMTISETMRRCYEARELPTWGEILNAADEIDRLSRQLAEAQADLQKRPVAWRVKDFADGWIIFQDEAQAYEEAERTGALMQGLYVRSGAQSAALQTGEKHE